MATKRVGELLRFNVSLPLWLILLFSVTIALVSYLFLPLHREYILFITELFGGAAVIYSAYYIGASLRLGLESAKKQRSFEILDLFNRPEFVRVRKFILAEVKDHENMSQKELYNKIITCTELLSAVTVVLGMFEDISIAIQNDHIDENILYRSLKVILIWYFTSLRGYVAQTRKEMDSNIIFLEAEKLVASWKNGLRLFDGKSLPCLD